MLKRPAIQAKAEKRVFAEGKQRKDADVIMHGSGPANPNEQWEKNVDITPAGNGEWPSASFLPQSGKTRAVPHTKINECDY